MATLDKLRRLITDRIERENMGQYVSELKTAAKDSRRSFERRWYDNNFFDDGFHFRYLSRQTNKIVDLSERSNIYAPMRAIPKASRQIRGVANLLVAPRYVPVVYPERILPTNYASPEEAKMAQEEAKKSAKGAGHWIEEEWRKLRINEQLAFMVILTMKHGISYMQVWPDAVKEKVVTQVYDAFDIFLMGNLTEISDCPFVIKSVPRLVSQIKADESFDQDQVEKINPDNRMASSDIKEAYATARFSREHVTDASVTVIQDEAFIKEYINDDNLERIKKQEDADLILAGKSKGDTIIRQTFTAGNIWLRDTYTSLPDYPFVDYRMEPGPLYQVPQMERFIPVNKSLDMVVSRLERFFHTVNVGAWLKRQGEQVNFNNQAGGQVIEYAQTKPEQVAITSPSAMAFPFLSYLGSLIEEQGVSTSTLGKIPAGVKANAAIESLKESEYATLIIAQDRLRGTVQKIAEKFLDIADGYFVNPKTVYYMEKNEPQYFDVIGKTALQKRKELNLTEDLPQDMVALDKEYVVDIQIENGLGFTREGQKDRMKELIDTMVLYAREGLIGPESIKVLLQRWLEIWGFGSTEEFMTAIDTDKSAANMNEQQITQMKTALLEALKDAGEIGEEGESKRIMENKIGMVEAMKDTGMIDALRRKEEPVEEKPPSQSISFKDLPPEGQVQMASQAGIQLDANQLRQRELANKILEAKPEVPKGGVKNAVRKRKTA